MEENEYGLLWLCLCLLHEDERVAPCPEQDEVALKYCINRMVSCRGARIFRLD